MRGGPQLAAGESAASKCQLRRVNTACDHGEPRNNRRTNEVDDMGVRRLYGYCPPYEQQRSSKQHGQPQRTDTRLARRVNVVAETLSAHGNLNTVSRAVRLVVSTGIHGSLPPSSVGMASRWSLLAAAICAALICASPAEPTCEGPFRVSSLPPYAFIDACGRQRTWRGFNQVVKEGA